MMNTSQARVIDPILTEAARGYSNPEFVGQNLFPVVPVGQRGGKLITFGKDSFYIPNTERSPGSNVAQVSLAYGSTGYSLADHSLSGKVPVELLEEANAVPGIDLSQSAVSQVQAQMALRLEKAQATLARTAGSYDSSNKATLSGSSQWSHADSKPSVAVEVAREAIRAKIGRYPNTLMLGAAVFAQLKTHALIIDRIKYTGRDSITPEMLAQLFDVDKVVIGKSVYADPTTGAFTDIWGKDAILAYVAVTPVRSQGSPSYGYTYRLKNYPVVEKGVYDRETRSWLYDTHTAEAAYLVGAEAGYLFTNAVA